MCGNRECHCMHGGGHGGGHQHGGRCHGEETACACGESCGCEQEAGGCHCGRGESSDCNCGQGGHCEHHGRHEHQGHPEEHASGFRRRFISRAERTLELEAYLSELRAESEAGAAYLKDIQDEATAVEERIAVLKAA
jgi:hypothetical protein